MTLYGLQHVTAQFLTNFKTSETELTASVLKEDQNTQKG